nr:MAG TPA: hypothetical protein [Caudoviricetes sp.]
MNGNASLRQYLQYHANNNPGGVRRSEAQALLNKVGDDGRLDGNFLMGQRGGFLGLGTREQTSNGYTASALNRNVLPWWINSYNSWRNSQNQGQGNTGNQNLNLGYYGGGGGGGWGGGNRASAAQLAEYDQGIGQLEHGLGRIDTQLGVRLGNINNQYNTKKNELRSSWNRAEGQFNDQTRQNQQQRRTNINNINDRSSVGLRGLLRSLGSMGAVGSDMQLAGRAVQNQASQQRSGAGQTYAQNQKQIDTTWGQFKNDYADEDKKLNDWKANEDSAARQSSQTTRQNLLTQLAQMKSQKAAAQGANGANAARADLGRANALSGEIDNLGRQQSTYSGNKVEYKAKDLDSYKVAGDTSVGVSDPANPGSDPTLSIYNTRLNQEEERKRQNQYL